MTSASRWIIAPALFLSLSSSALAASAWDGTWSGLWGGKPTETTSITIVGERVVSYEYQGISHPVQTSNVTARKVTYEDQGNTVTMTKISESSAHAALHTQQGDATAELTRR